jgi:divinyl chlorophyllide a 8-vinyl-reductase
MMFDPSDDRHKAQPSAPRARRVLLLGATGTIGRATVAALLARGHEVTCLVRPRPGQPADCGLPAGARVQSGAVEDAAFLAQDVFGAARFDAIVSCLASRSGTPKDAWAVDHQANLDVLRAGQRGGVGQFVLLSAICVQKPLLAFQHAKLAFEAELMASGLTWSIVRPTAYFKSLSGQVARVRAGRPFLMFGGGQLTACKPVSDADLGAYLADCLNNPDRQDRILPIGGPGPAITPRQQAEELFRPLDRPLNVRKVPAGPLDAIIAVLSLLGRVSPQMRDKAELARIGRYYATESMLVLDATTGLYDADATPSTGQDRLFDYCARLIGGAETVDLGEHAVF